MSVAVKKDETVKAEPVKTEPVIAESANTTEVKGLVTVPEVEETNITDAQCVEDAKRWGEVLAKEPKKTIKIKGRNNKDMEPVPVGINGYFYFINKNESVEVPQSVAKILEEADYI